MDKNSPEYREKRQKNNNAVKRSRDKSKQKNVEAVERVSKLVQDNADLEEGNRNMAEALEDLKDILLSHSESLDRLTPSTRTAFLEVLQDDAPVDLEKIKRLKKDITST